MDSGSRLPFFGVVRVEGDDRAVFLHNQLSNDIQHLAPGQACYATYNTPKGRVLANMLVLNTGPELWLVMAQDLIEPVIKRLRLYVLRSKVLFHDAHQSLAVAGRLPETAPAIDQPDVPPLLLAATAIEDGWSIALPHGGTLTIAPVDRLPEPEANADLAWQTHEINHGHPWVAAATTEVAVAQMLNQHRLGGVHFKKGCYPGQEIIARAQYRGQVKRGLALYDSPQIVYAGDKLIAHDHEVGTVINAVPQAGGFLLLAVVRFDAAAEPALHTEQGAPLRLKQRWFEQEAGVAV